MAKPHYLGLSATLSKDSFRLVGRLLFYVPDELR